MCGVTTQAWNRARSTGTWRSFGGSSSPIRPHRATSRRCARLDTASNPGRPEISQAPRQALRLGLRLLEVALLLPLLVTIVLAIGYVRATRARERAVEQAGLLLARRAADRTLDL